MPKKIFCTEFICCRVEGLIDVNESKKERVVGVRRWNKKEGKGERYKCENATATPGLK